MVVATPEAILENEKLSMVKIKLKLISVCVIEDGILMRKGLVS